MTDADTLIIGAGPAGLACAAMLQKHGRSSLILERADTPGSSWRRHYDRLHLHTHRKHSGLPELPMPRQYPRYPSREQVVDYLVEYAQAHRLAIRFGETGSRIARNGQWQVTTDAGTQSATRIIVATGLAHTPVRPAWPGQADYDGTLLHSSEFRNASSLGAGRVLIVGFGNSAAEIALECAESGLTTGLSVRSPVNVVPRDMFGLSTVNIAIAQRRLPYRLVDAVNRPLMRLRFGDSRSHGLEWAASGPLTKIMETSRTPLIDIGTMDAIKAGRIDTFGGIESTHGRTVRFVDGREADFDAIVLGTGYRPALETVLPDVDQRLGDDGWPPRSVLQPGGDGLFFCGFSVLPTGHLRQIGIEAREIAATIAAA